MRRILCWFGLHEWAPKTFIWTGGCGTGVECRHCKHYRLDTMTWER